MEKHCESVKRAGTGTDGWHRDEIVSKARDFLQTGGTEARRELVRTTLELDRLLTEARP